MCEIGCTKALSDFCCPTSEQRADRATPLCIRHPSRFTSHYVINQRSRRYARELASPSFEEPDLGSAYRAQRSLYTALHEQNAARSRAPSHKSYTYTRHDEVANKKKTCPPFIFPCFCLILFRTSTHRSPEACGSWIATASS